MVADRLFDKPRISINALSVLLTALVLTLSSLLVFLLPTHLPETLPHLVNYSVSDSGPQRMGHKLMLVLVAVSGLLVLPLHRWSGIFLEDAARRLSRAIVRCKHLPTWSLALLLPPTLAAYQGPGKDQFLLGIALSLVFVLFSARLAHSRTARALAVAAFLAYAALLLLPGFYGHYSFGENLDQAVLHYYGVFGLGSTLESGSADVLSRTSIFYGFVAPTISASIQHWLTPLHMGDYVRTVQWAQIAFTLLSLAGYRRLAPHAPVWALFCMTLWLPWIGTASPSMLAPTSSGLRFFGFALAPFVLLSARNLPRRAQALAFGATAGFALLNNLETGICVSLGLLAYAVLGEKASRIGRMLELLLLMVCGILVSFLAFALLFRVGLGYWPGTTVERLFSFLGNFSAGFAGLPLYFEILLLPVLPYPAYLVIRSTGVWLAKGLSDRLRFKFAISIMLLVWLAYYFNRPHHWNLWTHLYLLTFLIVDLAPWRMPQGDSARGGLGRLLRAPIPLGALVLIFILGPASVNEGLTQTKGAWRSLAERIASGRTSTGEDVFSGIRVGADCARDMREKVAALRTYAQKGTVVFAGVNQWMLILESCIVVPMAGQDIFNDSYTEANYLRMLKDLHAYSPDTVLLGADSPCAPPETTRANFNAFLGEELAPLYTREEPVAGWIVLKKR